jgi:hypothetical protein
MKPVLTCALGVVALAAVHASVARAQEPQLLFDGQSLDGWQTLDGKPITKGWEAVDAVLHLDASQGRAGHIVTVEQYSDFELRFDWKIAPGGNSGIKYRVQKFDNRFLGIEYQILDDVAWGDRLKPKGQTGSLYDIYPPNDAKTLNPIDQYNTARIVVWGDYIEHWLNGKRIATAHVGSYEWNRRIGESKFADVGGFGRNRYGKIMLTDHGSDVWYRNLVIRELPPPAPMAVAARSGGTTACRTNHRPLVRLWNRAASRCLLRRPRRLRCN